MTSLETISLATVVGGQQATAQLLPSQPQQQPTVGSELAAAAKRRSDAVNECSGILGQSNIGTSDSHVQRCEKMADELRWVKERSIGW